MERDRKELPNKAADDAKLPGLKEKPDVAAKSVGCSSLMMKNFENNASLLKLGMSRVTNLGAPRGSARANANAVNDDSLNKFLSSTMHANPHMAEFQGALKDGAQEMGQYPAATLASPNPQNMTMGINSTQGANAAKGGNPNAMGASCMFQKGQPAGSMPFKSHLTLNNLNACPVLGKQHNPLAPLLGRTLSGSSYLSGANANRSMGMLMHPYFTSTVDERPRDSMESSASNRESTDKHSPSRDGSESAESTSTYYNNVFETPEESLPLLKKMFVVTPSAGHEEHEPSEQKTPSDSCETDKFEWIPTEPTEVDPLTSEGDIAALFEDNFEEDCDGHLLSSYFNNSQPDLDIKLMNLSTIHESLYTSSDAATLRTLEKFLLQLLQQKNYYGNLTPFGKLLAFINLSFLKKHINLLDALYNHPEMSVIRNVLATNAQGQISKTLNSSAGIFEGSKLNSDETLNVFTQVMNKTNRDSSLSSNSLNSTIKSKHYSSGMKQNKQRLSVLDTLSSMYKPGGEPHFPRYVCGSIDRSLVVSTETISIPFEKSEKHNVHVQFEKFSTDDAHMWPKGTALPQNISEGTFVQVAPLKYGSLMTWKAGMVVSISSGQLMIKVPNEQKERMYILRNFVPPNVPIVKLEKGHWRLLPRELDITKDLYVGSCLSLLDLADPDESVDVVVLNLFFSDQNSPIAPVKLPSDETNFQHTNGTAEGDFLEKSELGEGALPPDLHSAPATTGQDGTAKCAPGLMTCSCNGYTLRVFEGRFVGVPERILVHSLHDKRDHVLNVAGLKGFKLNYDIQSHFDGPAANVQLPNSVWVVPRNISFLGNALATKDSQKAGYSWLFKPEYCLVMFPFSRSTDVLQDLCRLIPFLHPELNYLALCAGLWSLRNKPELREREAVSYTRSQKAAIRDLTSNDVVSEVCSDLIRCPFSLVRRLYGCFPVISLWIALDAYDPETDKEPTIPNNIKVPRPIKCEKCAGLVISKTGMVKIICNKYTQILAKKLTKKSKESGTNNPSFETLPQLDSDSHSKGGKDKDKRQDDDKSKGSDSKYVDQLCENRISTEDDGVSTRAASSPVGQNTRSSKNASDKGSKGSAPQTEASRSSEGAHRDSKSQDVSEKAAPVTKKEQGSSDFEELSNLINKGQDAPVLGSADKDLDGKRGNGNGMFDAIFSDRDYDVTPVLRDLERAEEWVKRAQTLANSRWRVTKEYTASYTVDDEFSILTTSPTTTSANRPNSDFLIQLAGVMSNIKRGKDLPIDPSLVYKLYQLSEECGSTTEGALLTGWSSYIFSEHMAAQVEDAHSNYHILNPRPSFNGLNTLRKDKDVPMTNMCPLNGVPGQPFGGLAPNNVLGLKHPAKPGAQPNGPARPPSVDLSSNYTQLLNSNPIFTDLSNLCKRKREDDFKKLTAFNKMQKNNHAATNLLPKLALQPDGSLLKGASKAAEKESPFINDPFDFCKFTDKPQRKKFVSSLKWDEDVEF